jgi:hypothetical protein
VIAGAGTPPAVTNREAVFQICSGPMLLKTSPRVAIELSLVLMQFAQIVVALVDLF